MGRRSQRSKKGSAIMAARVAAGLAPWTRMAGFIAKRFKPIGCVVMYIGVGGGVASIPDAAWHILPGQQLEDRVPCGMTLRWAMDDICHQAHKHQSGYCYLKPKAIVLLVAGLCAQTGAGAIGFDSKGDKPYTTMGPLPALVQLPALVVQLPALEPGHHHAVCTAHAPPSPNQLLISNPSHLQPSPKPLPDPPG
ncbi:hypothetical protein QJQ45_021531 [Haematococcus lacustris]|nr:hypothetical protein QJQ45_021531 [Haematococcus lacustris]